ncbi:MAG: Fic family protein [Parvularcula sp.]|jgi:Fic family protein|nr:Fic family protein [Parvularcula sp.]
MIKEIEKKKALLDERRPLTPGTLAQLDAWYDVELTYTSTAIEGNTLTRSETAIVLEKGVTVRGKPLKDHLEITDHKEALDYVRTLAAREEKLSERDVRDLHRLVLGRSNREDAGQYALVQRFIQGSTVAFPPPAEIPALMGALGQWLQEADATPENAFEAHLRLVTIHPFVDGNGRTARLLMNLVLLKGGYPPVIVAPEHRPDYIDALEASQLHGDGEPYRVFMFERLDESFDAYLDATSKELEARPGGPGPRPTPA